MVVNEFFLISCETASVTCLRLNKLEVPPAIEQGFSVLLHCDFDLQGDALYSVKWYKDYVEFYRFIPSDVRNKSRKFNLKGVFVDLSVSNDTHVFLSTTDGDSEGIYACEVSSEFPSFITIRVERQMKVFVTLISYLLKFVHSILQTNNDATPLFATFCYIRLKHKYNGTCATASRKYTNRRHTRECYFTKCRRTDKLNVCDGSVETQNAVVVAQPHQVMRYSTKEYSNGLQSTRLGLTFIADEDHFSSGVLTLRCAASVVLAYKFETSLQLIGGQRPKQSHETTSVVKEEKVPIIVGSKSLYAVGEPMDLNCTTNTRDSLLHWFINEDEKKQQEKKTDCANKKRKFSF
ncbi:uncharacterized protein B4U80_00352 [Leptotrombidium deliense]|uniref:Ig-like domain-containing protein n=1 Tax=Leptotrombidium deliense TaxID=299467 RepID=A0A443SKW1_9ACAR|nr:uncharacterized protein B4U80_00352 [Leptotrombidium deliense]